jgi:hypothetical protein
MHCFVTMSAMVEGAATESLAGDGPPSDPGTDGQTMQAQGMIIALSRERYSLPRVELPLHEQPQHRRSGGRPGRYVAGAGVLDAKLSWDVDVAQVSCRRSRAEPVGSGAGPVLHVIRGACLSWPTLHAHGSPSGSRRRPEAQSSWSEASLQQSQNPVSAERRRSVGLRRIALTCRNELADS